MTDRTGFLRTIIADPADDTARLIYADWLEDYDQPDHAALIRVQVELAQLVAAGGVRRRTVDRARFDELQAQERALLGPPGPPGAQPGRRWAMPPELEGEWPKGVGGWDWHRGFPELWWCPLRLWLACGRSIALRTPLQRVTVTDKEPAPVRVAGSPERSWYRDDESRWRDPPPAASILPRDLFDLLPADPFDFELFGVTRTYPSPDAAHAALSIACVEWARSPAGAML
jgi:uncharacterized protein (TIGR02996 family)